MNIRRKSQILSPKMFDKKPSIKIDRFTQTDDDPSAKSSSKHNSPTYSRLSTEIMTSNAKSTLNEYKDGFLTIN